MDLRAAAEPRASRASSTRPSDVLRSDARACRAAAPGISALRLGVGAATRAAVAMLLLASTVAFSSGPAEAAGALDRFENAHRPSQSGNSKPSSSSDDDDEDDESGSGPDSDFTFESDYDSDGDSGSSGDAVWALAVVCALPPITFACLHPSHRVAREPYDDEGHYVVPVELGGDDDEPPERIYLRAQEERFRWAELSISGFRAFNEPVVYSHDLELSAWLGPVVPHLRWEHFYEQIQNTGEWDHLDRFGIHLGANVTGPWVDFMEAYLLAGVGLLKGEALTPAFEAVLDLRFYPVEPLVIRPSTTMSVFGIGPVLFDVRLEAGVALGPLEIRLGPRFLVQDGEQGFWGPSAALVGRL